MIRYNLIFIFGGPACGKGTLCSTLAKKFDSFVHISPGDLVRIKQDLDPEYVSLMDSGKLLPTPFIGQMIVSHIKQNFGTDKTILLDGFPRNQENLDYYDSHMKDNFNLLAALILECEDQIMVDRSIIRAKQLGRTDDSEEVCKRRIKFHHEETEKIITQLDPTLVKKIYSGCEDDEYIIAAENILAKWISL